MAKLSLKIPDSQRETIQTIGQQSDAEHRATIAALESVPSSTSPQSFLRLAQRDEGKTLSFPLVSTLLSLSSLMEQGHNRPETIAEAVATDAVQTALLTEEEGARLKARLVELLSIASLGVTAKAFGLLVADRAPFADCRIVTDVRPVFSGTSDVVGLAGSLVVHQLIIDFANATKPYHVTLDVNDLRRLKQEVDRALQKDSMLRVELTKSGLAPIRESEEERL